MIGAALIFCPARWMGQGEGKQVAATAALSKSGNLLRERNVVNDQVSIAEASSLCVDFGLPDRDQAECVRRLRLPVFKCGALARYSLRQALEVRYSLGFVHSAQLHSRLLHRLPTLAFSSCSVFDLRKLWEN